MDKDRYDDQFTGPQTTKLGTGFLPGERTLTVKNLYLPMTGQVFGTLSNT